jgi:glycosyltransferase involved in cell wall biosynthesis
MLNALASAGKEVVFISNATDHRMFHPRVKHVLIGYDFNEKRKLQGLLGLFSWTVTHRFFQPLFAHIEKAIKKAEVGSDPVIFFDYLDNSIGYMLKMKGLICEYINDIHGIATLEFESHIQNARSVAGKVSNHFKHYLIRKLDKKVFENADGFIFGSSTMCDYYEAHYDIKKKKKNIIPYVLGDEASERRIDEKLRNRISKDLGIAEGQFLVLFVGGYKPTAGVDDLIEAFELLYADHPDARLLLIGSGPLKALCVKLAESMQSKDHITFIDQIPYSQLLTYQSIANVIVCPDKDNPFSQYVIHIKYFDALLSGRLVINGAFNSVKEVNPGDSLSLSFQPSNVQDLYRKLKTCHEEFPALMEKYKEARAYTLRHLTYRSYIKGLDELVSRK